MFPIQRDANMDTGQSVEDQFKDDDDGNVIMCILETLEFISKLIFNK